MTTKILDKKKKKLPQKMCVLPCNDHVSFPPAYVKPIRWISLKNDF